MEKLDKKNIEEILALTPTQEGMLFHYLKDPKSDLYFEQLSLDISGEVDRGIFEKAWDFVIETNEMQRTLFQWEKVENPIQIILKKHQLQLKYHYLSGEEGNEKKKQVEKIKVEDRREKFDLREVPFRITLCKFEKSKHVMIISNHHILYDGWSTGIILKEFFKAYNDLSNGKKLSKPVKTKFKEFVKWNQDQDIEKQEKFWRSYLKGIDTRPELSKRKRSRVEEITTTGSYRINFAKDIKTKLERFCKKHRITVASLLYDAWGLLLQKYNNTDDIILGTTISGRSVKIKGIEEIVGLFINTLPLRIKTDSNENTVDFLNRIDKELQMREAYETTSLVKIKEYSEIDNKEELFDSIVVIENYPRENRLMLANTDLSIDSYSIIEKTHYDLVAGITIFDNFELTLSYNEDVFDEDAIVRLANHYQNIVENITKTPGNKFFNIGILSEEEKNKILYEFNDTGADYPKDKTIHKLFEEQVMKTPDNMAISFENKQLTYGELNKKSNQLAHLLRTKGVKPDTIVGIIFERSFEMIIGIMAILKADGAYLPIDPTYPQERINYILADSGSKILLTGDDLMGSLSVTSVSSVAKKQPAPLTSLAYIIYTSGSTGSPKGVMVQQRSVVNVLFALHNQYPFLESDVYLLKTSYVFDVSVTELFGWFLAGGRLALLEGLGERSPQMIVNAIKRYTVTHINFVPSMFNVFVDHLNHENIVECFSLKYIFLAGEAILKEPVNKFRNLNSSIPLENLYGPTEAAVYASRYSLGQWENRDHIPIGTPIANVRLYILDRYDQLQPIGISGELCIGGAGLSRGYLNKPELTAGRFIEIEVKVKPEVNKEEKSTQQIPNKYISYVSHMSYIYKTGDLTRWLADGKVEFLGRMDDQVKIRGFRVELGEIQSQLISHPGIKETVAIARDDKTGDKYLCAYIVPHSPDSIQPNRLRIYLQEKLPDYMVPAHFVLLEKMPLTAAGKINRKALPEPGIILNETYVAPRNEKEKQLLKIWAEVLQLEPDRVGINDNFFELGGHSLKAVTLVLKIHKELNKKISLEIIFKHPFIRQLSAYIDEAGKSLMQWIKPVEEREFYELSDNQKRLWIINQLEPGSSAYNIAGKVAINHKIGISALRRSIYTIIERHDSLRTGFKLVDGAPVQWVQKQFYLPFEIINISGLDEPAQLIRREELWAKNIKFVFDPAHPPLFRSLLVQLDEDRCEIIFCMHHLISDGWSLEILKREFFRLYEKYRDGKKVEIEPLALQYKDFAAWQTGRLEDWEYIEKAQRFWRRIIGKGFGELRLPRDYDSHQPGAGQQGAGYRTAVKKDATAALKQVARDNQTSLFVVMCSAFNILLSYLTARREIYCGIPGAGREHVLLQHIVGFFLNTLVMKSSVNDEHRFIDYMHRVSCDTMEALQYQGYPLERILTDLKMSFPVIPVMFNMLNMQEIRAEQITGNIGTTHLEKVQDVKNDINIYITEHIDGIEVLWLYRKKIFKPETIEYIAREYLNLLQAISKNPFQKIKHYCVCSRKGIEIKGNSIQPANKFAEFKKEAAIQSIVSRFEEQVRIYPWHTAVKTAQGHFTYKTLNVLSNRGGRKICKTISRESGVALLFEHDIHMIVGILAALKAGAFYVPLDPEYPVKRSVYALKDSNVNILLTNRENRELARQLIKEAGKQIEIIDITTLSPTLPGENLGITIKPDDPAYVLYTSGTTGLPRGVLQNHHHVLHFIRTYTNNLHIHRGDKLTLFSSYGFDAAVMDIYGALLNGAALYPYRIKQEGSPGALLNWLRDERITIFHSIPTVYRYFIGLLTNGEKFPDIRLVVMGGEAVYKEDVEKYLKHFPHDCLFINGLGPTESTVTLQYFIDKKTEITKHAVPVGFPVEQTGVFLLTGNHREAPIFAPGEIIFKSNYLAVGYLNHPAKTHDVFTVDPMSGTGRVCRTGDLGIRLPNGAIEYVGRKDFQVKIRGYRVELGEVESILDKAAGIEKSVVVHRQTGKGDTYLSAYYLGVGKNKIEEKEIRKLLNSLLPDYMIPSIFIPLESFPLTPSGKIDRKNLPEPGEIQLSTGPTHGSETPGNRTQEKLLEIWSEILSQPRPGHPGIGIDDNFFTLGGHSLSAALLAARAFKDFAVKIPLKKIFTSPTIRELAIYIDEATTTRYSPVEASEKKDYYPLSSAQKRIYILQRMEVGGIAYNISNIFELEGELEINKLEAVFCHLLGRHEGIRTSFHMIADEPVQRVHEKVEFSIEYYQVEEEDAHPGEITNYKLQITNKKEGSSTTQYHDPKSYIHSFIRPFDLSRAPLLRVGLIEMEEQKHLLVVDMHHIIADGTSARLLAQDFMALYREEELPGMSIQYKDFSAWQNSELQRETQIKQKAYWQKQLEGEIPVLDLPGDYTRPAIKRYEGSTVTFEIGREEINALRSLSLAGGFTLYMIMLAIYYILLSKLGNREDILVGTPTAGRRHADLQQIIGMFVNTLVLRNYPTGDKTYRGFLKEIKQGSLEAFENQDYPFEELVEEVTITRDTSRNPLFDTMFVMQNMGSPAIDIPGLKLVPHEHAHETSKFDLALMGMEIEEKLLLCFEYSTSLFKKATIERFATYLKKIVSTVAANPDVKICNVEILSREGKIEILEDFNNTTTDYPKDKVIPGLFREQAAKTPDNIALIGIAGNLERARRAQFIASVTYRELNRKSNSLGHRLRQKGVKPGDIVGIMVDRSIEMMVGILGIIKAGGTYLPLDPEFPGERLAYIVEDSGASLILAGKDMKELTGKRSETVEINDNNLYRGDTHNLETAVGPGDPLYVIYTSGSTGRPKGVMIENRSMVNFIKGITGIIDFEESDCILSLTTISFDIFGLETILSLSKGSKVVIGTRQEQLNPGAAARTMSEKDVTILQVTPSRLSILVSNEESAGPLKILKYLLVGGEEFPAPLLEKIKEIRDGKIYNLYGPTETTIWSTVKEVSRGKSLNIGKPISNTRIYIIDKSGILQPIRVAGELCIAGLGLARGYLNNPELTKEKFNHDLWDYQDYLDKRKKMPGKNCKNHIQSYNHASMHPCTHASRQHHSPSSYHPITPLPKSPIYRTGDLAHWLPDGNIEFLGRLDYQVKIRGFRIELGEIESELLTHDEIKEAVVVPKEDKKGNLSLCAYFVSRKEFTLTQLRNHLSKSLPDYMLPSYFTKLDTIPLTPNGKIDRKALPEPEIDTDTEYYPPRNNIEKRLVDIWSEVLGVNKDTLGIDANFFELGGHSLTAIILLSRLQKEFNVKLKLTEIFKLPTIRTSGEFLRLAEKQIFVSIKQAEEKEYYRLSSAQKRLYVLQQLESDSTVYNMPQTVVLEGELEREKLEDIFRKLIKRHDSLRTSFTLIDEQPVQGVHSEFKFEIEYYQVKVEEGEQTTEEKRQTAENRPGTHLSSVIRHLSSEFIRPFDLCQAPLLRVGLIHTPRPKGHPSQEGNSGNRHILMVDMHHIISDGVSHTILIKDFIDLYKVDKLSPLPFQYKDFSRWQNREEQRKALESQKEYWLGEFEGEIPVLHLPTDYTRSAVKSFEGNWIKFEIDEEKTTALNNLAATEGTTLYTLLMALFNVLIAKISGHEDVVIGSPTAGRRHVDLEQIIGMFVNTLALRFYPGDEEIFINFLQQVKENTLNALENQDYPFEELVEQVSVNRDVSHNPLFDVMFVLQNVDFPKIEIPGLKLSPYEHKNRISKFDLELSAVEVEEKLFFNFVYCTRLFKQETIERFISFYKKIISSILNNSDKKISQIEIISDEEKKKILFNFNDTDAEYPQDKTIHELFEEQARKNRDSIAVIGEMQQAREGHAPYVMRTALTYSELDSKSHQLANSLVSKGVKPNGIVAIMAEHSVEMTIGILGILKTGCAYLPIAPDSPDYRIAYMLKDSSAQALVTTACIVKKSDNYKTGSWQGTVIPLPMGVSDVKVETKTPARSQQPTTTLIYAIYTSGSTGKPKGVLLTHQNLVNYVSWFSKTAQLSQSDKSVLTSSFAFDLGYSSLFPPLLNGGQLHLVHKETYTSPETLCDYIEANRITYLKMTPSLFSTIVEFPDSWKKLDKTLRLVLLGGESINVADMEKVHSRCKHLRIMNHYGPSESTIGSVAKFIDFSRFDEYRDQPTIGFPIHNTRIYILGKNLELLPTNIPGQLCISGDGLARGYLNRPGLTAEKFVRAVISHSLSVISSPKFSPNDRSPHYPITPISQYPIYRTGDLARWLPDGDIEFLGRMDHQVKIRGFRIELGEIEYQLLSHDEIKEAVVLVKEYENGNKCLCAYIVASKEFTVTQLRSYLYKSLPDYMLPSYFIKLDTIPLTPNGKIDRKALPEPEIKTGTEYFLPRNNIEKKLVDTWSEVLGVNKDTLGIDANFFELGGHSLTAIILLSRLQKEFNVKLKLTEIFKLPTIRELGEFLRLAEKQIFVSIKQVEEKEYYSLSSAQKRLYILHQMNSESTAYNMPQTVVLEGELEREKLEDIFRNLIKRHDSLRTSFMLIDEEPVQIVHSEVDFEVEYYDMEEVKVEVEEKEVPPGEIKNYKSQITNKKERSKSAQYPDPKSQELRAKSYIHSFIRPFDLTHAPLLWVGLIHTPRSKDHPSQEGNSGNRHILIVDMHHIISDGVSQGILIQDFVSLYKGEKLPPPVLQYKDYSEWQNKRRNSRELRSQENYWQNIFKGDIPVLELSTDYPASSSKDFEGQHIYFTIDNEQYTGLKKLSNETGTTLYMVLLAGYYILLSKYSRYEDIVVGTTVSGRNYADLENLIGMFVNMLPMRNKPEGNKTFLGFLEEVRENTLKAFENQDFQFDDLVSKLGLTRNIGENPLSEAVFNMLTVGESKDIEIVDNENRLKVSSYHFENHHTPFYLLLNARELSDRIEMTFTYSSTLFKKTTIEKMADHYIDIITQAKENYNIKLADIKISHSLIITEPTIPRSNKDLFNF